MATSPKPKRLWCPQPMPVKHKYVPQFRSSARLVTSQKTWDELVALLDGLTRGQTDDDLETYEQLQ